MALDPWFDADGCPDCKLSDCGDCFIKMKYLSNKSVKAEKIKPECLCEKEPYITLESLIVPKGCVGKPVEIKYRDKVDEIVHGKKTVELQIIGSPLHMEFYELIQQMVNTFQKKNSDYAGSDAEDMMKNFKRCENYGIKMSDGILTRMSDKITRMENLVRTRDQQVKDESLIDTVADLANYCLLLIIALKREQNENQA